MANIHLPHEGPAPVVGSKDGDYYDRCPRDGCLEVDARYKAGGIDGRGGEHRHWSLFTADRKRGGCGEVWARTTRQGRARDLQAGVQSKWATRAAAVERATSVPSEAFRTNWDRINWEK